ncbi:hypothetical protein GCM10022396_39910 [Flavivirga amylovorans]
MLKYILFQVLFLTNLALFAQGVTQARNEQNFNKDWLFSLGDNPQYREVKFEDEGWRKLNVPHDWSIEGEYQPDAYKGFRTGFFPEGIGWYRKHFKVDKNKTNKQFVIQFDGVYMNSEVWVNGRYCGRRPYGYATFQYDITAHLKFGEENIIAVRVDNSVPAGSRWYAGSGIYRNVHLIETNFVHFREMDGIYITTPVAEKDKATVKAEYIISSSFFNDEEIKLFKKNKWNRQEDRWENSPRAHNCIIRSIIYDAKGKEVARDEKEAEIFNYDKAFKISQDIEVKNPKRWSDTQPYLYTVKSEIEWNGTIVDDQITTIGIRKLEFNLEKGFLVNGERKLLKGVCLHHDGGAVGVAVPEKTQYYRLKKLKKTGCNAVRTAHNPFAPEFYRICDELGIYVMNEILDEWTSAWGYNFTDYNTSKAGNAFAHHFNQWYETEMKSTIYRDRNHPSVVMWSVGNELPELRSEPIKAKEIANKLIAIAHKEDATRPVTFGNNGPHAGFETDVDILGLNYVMENYDHAVRGSNIYEADHKKYPNKLIVGTETSRNEIDYYLAYRDNPYVIGQFIWTGIQYFGEVKAKKAGLRGWVASLLDMSLNLLPSGALYSSAWNDNPTVHITTSETSPDADQRYEIIPITGERVYQNTRDKFHWNWEKSGEKYVTVYSNCEEIELKLNGKSLGRKKTDFTKYATQWVLDYQEGALEAIGYNKGKKVSSNKLVTAKEPAKIKAKPYYKGLKADGVDVNIIEVSITDEKGNLVPTATNDIKVEVSGGAKLLVIDTGNLYYKGNFKTDHRNAANGYITVTVQSNGKEEPVKIKFTSEGLETEEIKL